MIVGSGEEESPGWAPRAAGPEQGFVFTEGRHESHVQDLRGLEEFSLLGSALLVGTGVHPEFLLPAPSGAPQHISLHRSRRSGGLGKHQKLSKEKHLKLWFTELGRGGEGCGQPQILCPSFSQHPPTRSILLHPHLRQFGLPAERAPVLVGVGSPFPAPPSVSQIHLLGVFVCSCLSQQLGFSLS